MKQRCIIVDDEQTARNILKKYVQEITSLELTGVFKNALEALDHIQKNTVDIIFLDIEMPKLSGINFAKLTNSQTHIIFTTAHREFALDGFELDATDYLLKPVSFERFLKAIQKTNPIKNETPKSTRPNDFMYVKVNKQMVKIDFFTLRYIEGMSNYIKLCTVTNTYIVYEKLSSILRKLPDHFLQVHKSYIVNTSEIDLFTKEYLEIKNKHIPVSKTYRSALLSLLKR